MERSWILIGMMGAGKSSVGRALGDLSGRPFTDTDTLIQQRFGRPITQIFQVYGEEAFRSHETNVLQSLEPEPIVLATGGGIVVRPENWTELRRLGTTIFLDVSFDVIKQRLETSKKKRPLLEVDGWEERLQSLMELRLPFYQQADLTVNVDEYDVETAAASLLRKLQEYENLPPTR